MADNSCATTQFDGLIAGGARQDLFLLLAVCGSRTARVLLIRGRYPVLDQAMAQDYRIIDRMALTIPDGGTVDVAHGACFRSGRLLEGAVVVSAVWGERTRVAGHQGLDAVIGVQPVRQRLVQLPVGQIHCLKDTP